MGSSFYKKEGLDFLSFQRQGTMYGSFIDKVAGGTQTKSGFYDTKTALDKGKKIKPLEMIYGQKVKPLLAQMWFDRAQKINNQLDHLLSLLEFFDYAAIISNRYSSQYLPTLQELETPSANKLYSDLTNFIAVYETYQSSDYDIYDVQYTV